MNSEDNSEVSSEKDGSMYTVRELAEMKLPNLPDTERAWLDRAKKGQWVFKEVPGRGRGGKKKVYLPPPEIMKLIEAHNHSVALMHLVRRDISGSTEKSTKKGERAQVPMPGQPSFDWFIRTAIVVLNAEWLPKSLKQDIDAVIKLSSSLFNFLTLYLGTSNAKWLWMMEHHDVIQAALRFVYGNDQMYADLEKDASENNDISKPVNKP